VGRPDRAVFWRFCCLAGVFGSISASCGRSSPFEPYQALEVIGQVGQPNLDAGSGHADGADERFDVGVIGGFARPAEAQPDVVRIGPRVQVPADELGALVDPDRLGIPYGGTGCLEGVRDVFPAIAEPRIQYRREPRERIDDGQHTDLATRCQLIMDKVHGPGIVWGASANWLTYLSG